MGNVNIYIVNGIKNKARMKVIIKKKPTTESKRKIGIENNEPGIPRKYSRKNHWSSCKYVNSLGNSQFTE